MFTLLTQRHSSNSSTTIIAKFFLYNKWMILTSIFSNVSRKYIYLCATVGSQSKKSGKEILKQSTDTWIIPLSMLTKYLYFVPPTTAASGWRKETCGHQQLCPSTHRGSLCCLQTAGSLRCTGSDTCRGGSHSGRWDRCRVYDIHWCLWRHKSVDDGLWKWDAIHFSSGSNYIQNYGLQLSISNLRNRPMIWLWIWIRFNNRMIIL